MMLEGVDETAVGDIPELGGLVVRPCSKKFAIWREGYGAYPAFMLNGRDGLFLLNVEYFDNFIFAGGGE